MTSRDFCYWLQGYFEIRNEMANNIPVASKSLTGEQVEMIERHLALVFKHEIDPSMGPPSHQSDLNSIHSSPFKPGGALRC